MNRFQLFIAMLLSMSMLIASAGASIEPKPSELESSGIVAMTEQDYERAESIFRELIELRPDSFVGHYNLSAALSMQGDAPGAIDAMSKAIAIGFSDLGQIRRDPDLDTLRQTSFFSDLVAGWQSILDARRSNDLGSIKLLISKQILTRTNEQLKLELVSAHDQIATDEAFAEIELIADWVNQSLFPELKKPSALHESPWVMVALPDRAGFAKWAITVFGPSVRGSVNSVGGAYEHQNRRLVAQDLGATLRHEFVHVQHWRDMNRLGQAHAPWIQEGLASIVEDYDMRGGKLVPVASWRTNIVKRMNDVHRMPTIETLAKTEMNSFTSNRPLAKYAQARTIMLYLLDQGKLSSFYQTYTAHFQDDPSGIKALEDTLGKEIDEIDDDFEKWVEALTRVPETGSDLSATLGIEIQNGTGDGVVVKVLPGDARSRTGLRLGSVITAINGRPTRDLLELIRVLGDYGPGQTVTLNHRRGTIHSTSDVKLLSR